MLAVLALSLGGVAVVAAPAQASGSYDNAIIADLALPHAAAHEVYGECWTFVRDMVYQASNGTQDISAAAGGSDYFAHLLNAGGTEITNVSDLTKGDVVQKYVSASDLHTFIIVSFVSGSNFDVVDANYYNNDQKATEHSYSVVLSSTMRAFRMGTASGSSLSDGPPVSAASNASGENYAYWRNPTSGNLMESWYAGGAWHGPANLGMGSLGSAPTVAIAFDGSQYVFWKGGDGHLWEAWYSNGWNGPVNLGMGTLGSQPSATAWGSEIDVFWKGTDGALWEAWYAAGWHGSVKIGMGTLGSAPTAASRTNGDQFVYWRGTQNSLWQASYTSRTWHGATNLGMGTLGSGPSASARPGGDLTVFWRGGDGSLWQAFSGGNTWYGPNHVGMGTLGSAPSVTAASGQVNVYWRCTDGNLCQGWYAGSSWYGPATQTAGPIGT